MVKDLVCGMMVDEKNPPAKVEYQGKTYYFCCEGCKKKFLESPETYVEKPGHGAAHHHGH